MVWLSLSTKSDVTYTTRSCRKYMTLFVATVLPLLLGDLWSPVSKSNLIFFLVAHRFNFLSVSFSFQSPL